MLCSLVGRVQSNLNYETQLVGGHEVCGFFVDHSLLF